MQHRRSVFKGSTPLSFYFLLLTGQNTEMLTGAGAAMLYYEVNLGIGAMLFRTKTIKRETAWFLTLWNITPAAFGFLDLDLGENFA